MSEERHRQSAEPDALADAMAEVAESVATTSREPAGLDRLRNVPLSVTVELGRTRMRISDVLDLSPGSVVELTKLASEPVDILVNGTLFAHGEVVVVDDSFAVKILEVLEDELPLTHA
jgi:flagellar motor switch protein FliN/FliY